MFEEQKVDRSQEWVVKVEGRVRHVTDYTWSQAMSGFHPPRPGISNSQVTCRSCPSSKSALGAARGMDNGSVFLTENTSSTLRSPGGSQQQFKCFTSTTSPNPARVHNTDATAPASLCVRQRRLRELRCFSGVHRWLAAKPVLKPRQHQFRV